MAQDYKVIMAGKDKEITGKQGNTLIVYKLALEGVDGLADLLQSPNTPVPQAGETLTGTIEDTQYGKKFKKERPAGSSWGGGKDQDTIRAEWAIGQAVQWAGLQGTGWAEVEPVAKKFYQMVDNVKNVGASVSGSAAGADSRPTGSSAIAEPEGSEQQPTTSDRPPLNSYEGME